MASLVSVTVRGQTSGMRFIRFFGGGRTDVWDVILIWAHSVTGTSVSHSCGNAVIDTPGCTYHPRSTYHILIWTWSIEWKQQSTGHHHQHKGNRQLNPIYQHILFKWQKLSTNFHHQQNGYLKLGPYFDLGLGNKVLYKIGPCKIYVTIQYWVETQIHYQMNLFKRIIYPVDNYTKFLQGHL